MSSMSSEASNDSDTGKLRAWVDSLSSESCYDLDIVLSIVVPDSEIVSNNVFGFSSRPISYFDLVKHGVSEDRALHLLSAIAAVLGEEENINLDGDMVSITMEGIATLRKVREYVNAIVESDRVTEGASTFEDDTATLTVDSIKISLPPNKNEHWFCRSAYKHAPREPVSWDTIFGVMSGSDFEHMDAEDWRKVYDTMRSINTKVQAQKLRKLFEWSEKTVIRSR